MELNKGRLTLVDVCSKQLGRVYRRVARLVQASKNEEYPHRIFRSKHHSSREVHTRIMRWVDNFVYYLVSAESPVSPHPVIVGIQVAPMGRDLILYNPEQMTRESAFLEFKRRFDEGDIVEIWDYSRVNTAILKERGYPVRWVPYRIDSARSRELFRYEGQAKEYDVGFCGSISARRALILSEMEERGLRVLKMDNLSGAARDRMLGKCWVVLNVHADTGYCIFESIRCEPWLHVNMPVVSETSLDDDMRCINLEFREIVPWLCKNIADIRQGKAVELPLAKPLCARTTRI
jgi:hypothetical protein